MLTLTLTRYFLWSRPEISRRSMVLMMGTAVLMPIVMLLVPTVFGHAIFASPPGRLLGFAAVVSVLLAPPFATLVLVRREGRTRAREFLSSLPLSRPALGTAELLADLLLLVSLSGIFLAFMFSREGMNGFALTSLVVLLWSLPAGVVGSLATGWRGPLLADLVAIAGPLGAVIAAALVPAPLKWLPWALLAVASLIFAGILTRAEPATAGAPAAGPAAGANRGWENSGFRIGLLRPRGVLTLFLGQWYVLVGLAFTVLYSLIAADHSDQMNLFGGWFFGYGLHVWTGGANREFLLTRPFSRRGFYGIALAVAVLLSLLPMGLAAVRGSRADDDKVMRKAFHLAYVPGHTLYRRGASGETLVYLSDKSTFPRFAPPGSYEKTAEQIDRALSRVAGLERLPPGALARPGDARLREPRYDGIYYVAFNPTPALITSLRRGLLRVQGELAVLSILFVFLPALFRVPPGTRWSRAAAGAMVVGFGLAMPIANLPLFMLDPFWPAAPGWLVLLLTLAVAATVLRRFRHAEVTS